jgi:hypothetical protein
MGEITRVNARRNWVAWLAEQNREKEPTPQEKYKQMCVDAATDVGQRYDMDLAEVMISPESVHIYYRKGSKLYINIIPRSLIIRTCKLTPHLEKAVRLQLFRQKKKAKATNNFTEEPRTVRMLP